MNKVNKLVLGLAAAGVLLTGLTGDVIARAIGGLYGNRLYIETEPRNATPDVTVGDDDAFIAGTLEADGNARLDGTLRVAGATTAFGTISVSSAATANLPFVLDGQYTSAQLVAKTPSAAGQLVYNTTISEVCVSTGATVQGYARVKDAATCQ